MAHHSEQMSLGSSTAHGSQTSIHSKDVSTQSINPSTIDQNEIPTEKLEQASIHTSAVADPNDPGPPPDGGLRAWTQVLVGHLVVFNSWGYISSYGVFQAYYTTSLKQSPSDISWVGSVQIFLIYFLSTFSGRAMDAGYYRHVITAGLTLQVLGVFMTSLSTKYWQLFLAQGICQGLGDGLVFCPTVALISTYFVKNRAVAISFIASGFATGGTVFPIIARQLLYKIGFAWTIRIMGFVILANAAVILSLARVRIPPRKTGPFIEWGAFKDPAYVLFSAGMLCAFLGVYFAYYYVSLNINLVTDGNINHLLDCSLRRRHYWHFFYQFTQSSISIERYRSTGANCPCYISRSLSWTGQYDHYFRVPIWYSHLLLGRSILAGWTMGIFSRLWFLWCRSSITISPSIS